MQLPFVLRGPGSQLVAGSGQLAGARWTCGIYRDPPTPGNWHGLEGVGGWKRSSGLVPSAGPGGAVGWVAWRGDLGADDSHVQVEAEGPAFDVSASVWEDTGGCRLGRQQPRVFPTVIFRSIFKILAFCPALC